MTNASNSNPRIELKTLGHATLLVSEGGVPLIATDPWIIGSTYWRSWWLEKYPTSDEIGLIRRSRYIYVTHSHPDHFHWPSLRHLGPRKMLSPRFPDYAVPDFLRRNSYPCQVLEPFQWYELTPSVRICSIPVPIDDSVLVIETPNAVVVDLNDSFARRALLESIRKRCLAPGKTVLVLKSYSPASSRATTFKDGERASAKTKKDFVNIAQGMAEALGARYFIPFASQAFFGRTNSRWANDDKVTYEDLAAHWKPDGVTLCRPFISMDLGSFAHTSGYDDVRRRLDGAQRSKVDAEEAEEDRFCVPEDFDDKLKEYLDQVSLLRAVYRRGIGFRLTSSKTERFYVAKTRRIERAIPNAHDLVISVPDKVLWDALQHGILTDLGITLFVRIDTKIGLKRTQGLFPLMGLHDYGHSTNTIRFARFLWAYAPYLLPGLASVWPRSRPETLTLS